MQEGEKHKSLLETFKERIRPQKYSGFMSHLISEEPSSYEEATSKQVWVDAMIEEYSSIMYKKLFPYMGRMMYGKLFPDQQKSQ